MVVRVGDSTSLRLTGELTPLAAARIAGGFNGPGGTGSRIQTGNLGLDPFQFAGDHWVELPNPAVGDDPVRADEEGLGDAQGPEPAHDALVRIQEDEKGDVVLFDEASNLRRGGTPVHAGAHHSHPLITEGACQSVQSGHLPDTRGAPRGPDIQDHYLTS